MDDDRTNMSFEESVKKAFDKAKIEISNNNQEIKELKTIIDYLKVKIDHFSENNALLRDLIKRNAENISYIQKEGLKSDLARHPLSSTGTRSTGNERVPVEEELVRKFRRNRADIVKAKILSMLEEYSVYEMFHSIVIQQGLCGKTSFYRYIKDLEVENIVRTELIDGRRILIKCEDELIRD
jgi:hypothetical protein